MVLEQPFVSPSFEPRWVQIKKRLFQTRKILKGTQSIAFFRVDSNGNNVNIGPFDVVVIYANTQQRTETGPASTQVAESGEFQREIELGLPVLRGDRFCFSTGACGEVTNGPTPDIAFVKAPFEVDR